MKEEVIATRTVMTNQTMTMMKMIPRKKVVYRQ